MPHSGLLQPQFSFHVAQAAFLSNFAQYTGLAGADIRNGEALLRGSALFLELFAFVACAAEEAERVGRDIIGLAAERPHGLVSTVRDQCGIDFDRTFSDAVRELELPDTVASAPDMSVKDLVRPLEAVVTACPIAELTRLGTQPGLEQWAHRCRGAYDALRAFLYRNDAGRAARVAIIGRKYMMGALSLTEVATLLQVDRADAVSMLERSGCARPLEVIRLGEEERNKALQELRHRRLHGPPFRTSPEKVTAEVIASERLEGIDARLWMTSEGRASSGGKA